MNPERIPNHLIHEKSPYLLSHAYNPVDWHPWGEEAFQAARDQGKLVFLSIGYHSCHWCHVMERESFEDPEVAKLLNSSFISVKVDREERKDVDSAYMKVCQAMTGSGGWPLNLFLTPDRKPLYAGTYFPKRSMGGRPGLMETASAIRDLYREDKDRLLEEAEEITRKIKSMETRVPGSLPEDFPVMLRDAFRKSYDREWGGFSGAPKFPVPSQLLYLLDSEDPELEAMALFTLDRMLQGGLWDHIGGGFFRYSTDRFWLIPHFEKMLYDNSLMMDVLAKAYQRRPDPSYREAAMGIKTFLVRELMDPSGGFYTALDADSEGAEGRYYVFTREELIRLFGEEEGKAFCHRFGVTEKGNFEGWNHLYLKDGESVTGSLQPMIQQVLDYRSSRIPPATDDKILTLCNGLAIHGFLSLYETFDDPESLNLALSADAYLALHMEKPEGLLVGTYQGEGHIRATLEDYGAVIRSLIRLHQVTQEESFLQRAAHLTDRAITLFWDGKQGGFFTGALDNPLLFDNPKEVFDGAIPSGNSLMAENLFYLSLLLDSGNYREQLRELEDAFSGRLRRYGIHSAFFLRVLMLRKKGERLLRIYVPDEEKKKEVLRDFSPSSMMELYPYDAWQLLVRPKECPEGFPVLSYCSGGACGLPVPLSNLSSPSGLG